MHQVSSCQISAADCQQPVYEVMGMDSLVHACVIVPDMQVLPAWQTTHPRVSHKCVDVEADMPRLCCSPFASHLITCMEEVILTG